MRIKSRMPVMALFVISAFGCVGSHAIAQSARPSTRDALGCADKDLQNRIATIANSGDHEAFKKLAGAAVLAGKCRIVNKGTMLFTEDTAIMSGLACFRPVGDVACLWMASDLTR